MSKHHLSNATTLSYGEAYFAPAHDRYGHRGAPITPIAKVSLGSPAALDADGYAAAQAVATAKNLTLNGALSGVADVARGVQAVSSDAGDTTQTVTFYGLDGYGIAVAETLTLTGTTPVLGKKAFKSVSRIAVSAACTGNVSAGTSDKLGLPLRLNAIADHLRVFFNDAVDASATVVKGDATTATATTGDVRGTVDPNSACNGSAVSIWMMPDPASKESLFGIAQYGG